VVSAALVAIGVVATASGHPEGLWYVVMGVFIWFLARAARRAVPPPVQGRALALTGEGEAA
jgi:type IV secretory pathway TrbD component